MPPPSHPSDVEIEEQAPRSRLNRMEITEFEIHFLVCKTCRDKVAAEGEIIEMIRLATPRAAGFGSLHVPVHAGFTVYLRGSRIFRYRPKYYLLASLNRDRS